MTTSPSSPAARGARGTTGFYRLAALLLAAFFGGIALVSLAVWVKNGHIAALAHPTVLLWVAYAALCWWLVRKTADTRWTAAVLFAAALLPRLALCFVHTGTPTSDFANYWAMGQAFLRGDGASIAALVDQYRVLEFSGLAALWGGMQWITGGSLLGFQILQCCITAGIAVAIYALGSQADKRVGRIAALLFALYPSNLVMAQVFTNQHLAVLLALCSILLFLHGLRADRLWQRLLYGALAGLALLVSHYAHASSMITRIAFALYAILLCFALRRQTLRILAVLAACLLLFSGGKALVDGALLAGEYRLPATEQFHQTERILTGLTAETDGQLDQAQRDAFRAMTDEQANAAILQKFKQPIPLLKLFARKAAIMWGAMDSSFVFYTHEANETPQTLAIASALGALDVVYVAAVYLLAALGLCIQLFVKRGDARPYHLPMLLVAGWIGVYLVYEIQMRYRYYAMPFLMIFAALGLTLLLARGRKKGRA